MTTCLQTPVSTPPDDVFSETQTPIPYASGSYNVVSPLAYLIGVKPEFFGKDFLITVYAELETKPQAKIIRCLCSIRNALMKYYARIDQKMRYEITNIDKMPDYISPEFFKYLRSQQIEIVKINHKVAQYLIDINKLIADHINPCHTLFPMWVNWDYIRALFTAPGGIKPEKAAQLCKTFSTNRNSYPFHCYIDWPIHKVSAYHTNMNTSETLTATGNILLNDRKFLTLLYRVHHDEFMDTRKVRDVSQSTKTILSDFIDSHSRIAVVVDCENSDPYKLTAALRNLKEYCERNDTDYYKIQKIILYDDTHTVHAWRFLDKYLTIPIQHELENRVNEHKSLVDVRMTAGTCKEHYTNGIDGFLLASSDSDYWGLISSLPTADFLVLVEKSKLGSSLVNALNEHEINYCKMDDFAENMSRIKTDVLKDSMKTYLEQRLTVNIEGMMAELYEQNRMSLTTGEKKAFYDRYVKTMKLEISSNSQLKIRIAE